MSNLSAGQFSQNVILTKWRHILLLPASDVNKEPFRVNKRGRYLAQLLLSLSLVAGRGVCLEVYHALDRLVISLNAVIIDMNFIHVRWNFFSLILSFFHFFSLSQFLPKRHDCIWWLWRSFLDKNKSAWNWNLINLCFSRKKKSAWNRNWINLINVSPQFFTWTCHCILMSLFKYEVIFGSFVIFKPQKAYLKIMWQRFLRTNLKFSIVVKSDHYCIFLNGPLLVLFTVCLFSQ